MGGTSDLKGVMAAIASPCDEKEAFQEKTFYRLAEYTLTQGLHGLYVCGATGDGFSMAMEDRKRATVLAVDAAKKHGGSVITHVGSTCTRDSIVLAEHAAEAGADAIASMPLPMKNSPPQLASYYSDIARASGLPTLIYYVPAVTQRVHTFKEMLDLLDIAGVVGMKFSDPNYFLMRRLLMDRPDAVVFTGWDELLCPGMLYGARGGIGMTYNLYPKLFRSIYDAMVRGDIAKAMEFQLRFIEHWHVVSRYGPWPCFDSLMRSRGYGPSVLRRPKESFDKETERRFLSETVHQVEALLNLP